MKKSSGGNSVPVKSTTSASHRRASGAACSALLDRGFMSSVSAHAARGHDEFARDPARVVRRKKRDDRSDVLHLADATERCLSFIPGLEVRAHGARAMRAFGFD